MEQKHESKEGFCSTCVMGIGALVGVGTSASSKAIKNKKRKKIVFWVGVAISLLSILILVYLLFRKCEGCR